MSYLFCKETPPSQDDDYFTEGRAYLIVRKLPSNSLSNKYVMVNDNRGKNSEHRVVLDSAWAKRYFVLIKKVCKII